MNGRVNWIATRADENGHHAQRRGPWIGKRQQRREGAARQRQQYGTDDPPPSREIDVELVPAAQLPKHQPDKRHMSS